jgi:hypothetical protein
MSTKNTLQKTFVALLAGLILGLGPAQSVKAQFFGISLDTAIGYSAAKKGVIGGSVGITHPIPLVPNLGVSSLKFAEDSDYQSTDKSKQINLNTANSITTINIFYNVPFPVVSMAIGLGYGNFLSQTTMTYADSDDSTKNFVDEITEQKLPVTEGFIHVGLPFWNIIEFHIGYHLFSVATINLEKGKIYNYEGEGYNISKGVYTGGMSTIGIQLAF